VILWRKVPVKQDDLSIPEPVIIGTSADFPPLSYKQNGEVIGFDIDVVKEVARRLGSTIIIKDMPFDMLIPQLQLGNIHIIAAGMVATPARQERAAFTKPYLTQDYLVAVTLPEVTLKDLHDLDNKTVIVNQGYTADSYMSQIPGPILQRLPTVADALLALKTGRAFAFVTSYNTLLPVFEQYGKSAFSVYQIPETHEQVSLAITKCYPELIKKAESAIEQIKTDGTISQLKEKWHVI
ncbi:MAG TPA: transporter substrate-binding domain-containing protein, partial [Candidatus Babeliaceae bacterium]|nr:transporter substrate-binding domain-containing protein [Candidatus Babeliaceae bacterium]